MPVSSWHLLLVVPWHREVLRHNNALNTNEARRRAFIAGNFWPLAADARTSKNSPRTKLCDVCRGGPRADERSRGERRPPDERSCGD